MESICQRHSSPPKLETHSPSKLCRCLPPRQGLGLPRVLQLTQSPLFPVVWLDSCRNSWLRMAPLIPQPPRIHPLHACVYVSVIHVTGWKCIPRQPVSDTRALRFQEQVLL